MKLMDEKGRLFGKLNVFDLLIILLILVGLVAMATRLAMPGVPQDELKTATYVLEYSRVEECFKDAFQVGDTMYENGENMGTVTAVEVSPAKSVKIQPDGTYRQVEHAVKYQVRLTVTTDRFRIKDGFHVGTQELLAGTSHDIGNGFAQATAVVRSVEY